MAYGLDDEIREAIRQITDPVGYALERCRSQRNEALLELDRLRAEVEALRPLADSAQKAAEQMTAMTAELHEQRDEIERLREMQGGFRHLDDLRRAMCDCADDNARLRAEVESLRKDAQRYQYIKNKRGGIGWMLTTWDDFDLDAAIDHSLCGEGE